MLRKRRHRSFRMNSSPGSCSLFLRKKISGALVKVWWRKLKIRFRIFVFRTFSICRLMAHWIELDFRSGCFTKSQYMPVQVKVMLERSCWQGIEQQMLGVHQVERYLRLRIHICSVRRSRGSAACQGTAQSADFILGRFSGLRIDGGTGHQVMWTMILVVSSILETLKSQ